ncbi:MAG: oxidoreductase [Acidobacteria bacterium]|nr:oxidoreductase [Acidobacteriota bacterium]
MRGWLATKTERSLGELDPAQNPLEAFDRQVRVEWSAVNYKDALAITGQPGVMRRFPMVPGVDLAGEGIVVNGCGLSEHYWGGYATEARLKNDWIVDIPAGLSARDAAAIGTAGFTAMQCIDALERHGLRPGGRDVVVTGAAGGVGSFAVALLKAKGYRVVASTGRPQEAGYLTRLGAAEILDRAVLSAPPTRPMDSERWGGAVDTVGGETLAGLIRGLGINTAVAACGLAGGAHLNTTVYPFILRGVSLLGINSVEVAPEERRRLWAAIGETFDRSLLADMVQEITLDQVMEFAPKVLAGQVRGRLVVRIA